MDVVFNAPPPPIAVQTPGSAPAAFPSAVNKPERVGVLGVGVSGPETVQRVRFAFRSQHPAETRWAVTALVEISFRTPEVLCRVENVALLHAVAAYALASWPRAKTMQTERDALCEALLVLRNVCLDSNIAHALGSSSSSCRDCIVEGILLAGEPVPEALEEAVHLCFEIGEQISVAFAPNTLQTPIYPTLCQLLHADDRFYVLAAMRIFARQYANEDKSRQPVLETKSVHHVLQFLFLEDKELVSAALDMVYQLTSGLKRLDELVGDETNTHWVHYALSTQLVRLLTHGVEPEVPEYPRLPRRTRRPAPAEPPKLPVETVKELVRLDEPDRATAWIRVCYEPEPDSEVTQISLWKAYEQQFEPQVRAGLRLLPAVDFIKNAAGAFRNAAAMVVNLPDNQRKFVIKGIQPREVPVTPDFYKRNQVTRVLPDARARQPPAFGPSAVLVLENVAKLQGGAALLAPHVRDLVSACVVNKALTPYVDNLLGLIA